MLLVSVEVEEMQLGTLSVAYLASENNGKNPGAEERP